mgnify:CR=1 FL=1|tara:strand:+ start:7492 stop:7662 length:171 start_codon:yes stop_codon:yes gene_type:complete
MEYKIYKDCTFRADKFEKGKSYKLTSKEYRCLKAMGVLDAPKKTKKDSVEKTDLTN